MKKLLFFIAALLPTLVFAQQATSNFTVNGKVGNIGSPARAYLFYQIGETKVVDSSLVVNGSFTISGFIPAPSNSLVVIDHLGTGISKLGNTPDMLNFFLDKGTTAVTSKQDSISKGEVTGSAVNDDDKYLTLQLKPINDEAKKINDEKNAAPQAKQNSPDFQHSLDAKIKVLQDKQQAILKAFVTAHPASYISLLAINLLSSEGVAVEALFNGLDPSVKEMEIAKMIKKSIDDRKVTDIGVTAPDFTQPDVNGNPIKLSSFRGKYVLVDFWASWCGPCRAENPNVVKAYNKYKTKNFTVLGVSLDKPGATADWQAAIKNDGLTWTQVSDLKFWKNEAAALYLVHSIPANFLIDPNGKIIAKNLRGTDLEDKLAELFGKI
ncbi:MAG: hypothetical protein JWR50_1581 [Mucilaginibacter sp.]|nr:hypothetical protein [Mucilaginibacter sp.]